MSVTEWSGHCIVHQTLLERNNTRNRRCLWGNISCQRSGGREDWCVACVICLGQNVSQDPLVYSLHTPVKLMQLYAISQKRVRCISTTWASRGAESRNDICRTCLRNHWLWGLPTPNSTTESLRRAIPSSIFPAIQTERNSVTTLPGK